MHTERRGRDEGFAKSGFRPTAVRRHKKRRLETGAFFPNSAERL
jgi:hypothetical protein